jgi:hypothetical protein
MNFKTGKVYLRRLIVSIFAVLSLLLVSGLRTSRAQDHDETIRVDTNLVLLNVLVRDKRGVLVPGLRADQFEILVDGRSFIVHSSCGSPVS